MPEWNVVLKALAHYTPLTRHAHVLVPAESEQREKRPLTRMEWLLLVVFILWGIELLWLLFALTTIPIL